MKARYQRLWIVLAALLFLGGATGLILTALQENLAFFYAPAELRQNPPEPGLRIRLGGLVEEGSLISQENNRYLFAVTDFEESVPVYYQGLLPDLFREGQGVVAEGTLGPGGVFNAEVILAKHDENYMPREVVDALKESGVWQHGPGGDP